MININQWDFAERLAYARRLKLFNQSELARASGLSPSSVNKWESRDYSVPSGKSIRVLAKALEVNPHWLLTGEGDMYEVAQLHIVVPGEPRAWSVYTRRGPPSKSYLEMQGWQEQVRAAAIEAMDGPLIESAVDVSVDFVRRRPAWAPKTKRLEWSNKHILKRPDTTNYYKAFEDALTGIVWKDDSQVTKCAAAKLYGPEAMTVATIRW